MTNHQKCDEELEVMKEAIEYQKKAFGEITMLQNSLLSGCNKTMAISQLETIIEYLEKRAIALRSLKKKNLPPNLITKRDVLLKSISDAAAKATSFIEGFN